MTKGKSNSNSYELSIVHPAVAEWLTAHDYVYEHEVYMPDYGRADFVATHDDGHMLIVECKADCKALSRAITQVSDYRQQYNKRARIAVAAPNLSIDGEAAALCNRRKALLIGVDVPLAKRNISSTVVSEFIRDYIGMQDREYKWVDVSETQRQRIEDLLTMARTQQAQIDYLLGVIAALMGKH